MSCGSVSWRCGAEAGEEVWTSSQKRSRVLLMILIYYQPFEIRAVFAADDDDKDESCVYYFKNFPTVSKSMTASGFISDPVQKCLKPAFFAIICRRPEGNESSDWIITSGNISLRSLRSKLLLSRRFRTVWSSFCIIWFCWRSDRPWRKVWLRAGLPVIDRSLQKWPTQKSDHITPGFNTAQAKISRPTT